MKKKRVQVHETKGRASVEALYRLLLSMGRVHKDVEGVCELVLVFSAYLGIHLHHAYLRGRKLAQALLHRHELGLDGMLGARSQRAYCLVRATPTVKNRPIQVQVQHQGEVAGLRGVVEHAQLDGKGRLDLHAVRHTRGRKDQVLGRGQLPLLHVDDGVETAWLTYIVT
jgi:hypothetical protein